jgi:mono/diheme cytochrome c family protein
MMHAALAVTLLAAGGLTRADADLARRFSTTVRPFVERNCAGCHGGAKPKADLDLTPFKDLASVTRDFPRWAQILERMQAGEMPPPKEKTQPTAEERQQAIAWIEALKANESRKHAGDPGPVLARRLSNAEYNYTIRDLTGADIRPAREFPVDPSNAAGFANSGESLNMSPALLTKYLAAAREVANHLVLESEGIAFAPHPMLVETDRDKYCVRRIVDFYQQQNTDLAAYFTSAWRWKHRAALDLRGKQATTLAALAARDGLSPRYLATVWKTLEGTRETVGPLAKLQGMWQRLPAPRGDAGLAATTAGEGATAMRDFVVKLRKKLEPRFDPPAVKGMRGNSQPLAMWRNRQYADHRLTCDRQALQVDGRPLLAKAGGGPKRAADEDAEVDEDAPQAAAARDAGADPDLAIPSADRARHEAAFDRFCAVFPDRFYVSERGRNYDNPNADKGRLLSAGFHNLMGYFRDDQPLYQLLLDDKQRRELDRLWREMDFVASTTSRTYLQFYFSGGGAAVIRNAPKDAPPPPAREVLQADSIARIKQLFLANVAAAKSDVANAAITRHFDDVNTVVRWTEQARVRAEPTHLAALQAFAARAYRRPLHADESAGIKDYYRSLRDKGLDHEEAMRDSLVSVLMSPDFCYRLDQAAQAGAGPGVRPLDDFALASRLSYFLWSSTPDDELLAHARARDLHRPRVLVAQAHRMLKDARVRGLAVEFGGGWLDFRRFEEHNGVDREHSPAFDNDLRGAMFEEPVRVLLDVFREGRPVLDLLYGDYTFVNAPLARHYGMPADNIAKDAWVRVADAGRYGRGGLLPMAVFLTKNAPGLRTSPVKRGYWVVKNVLGERIPPPPAVVPELPREEAKAELPLRELLAKHREDAACAACHARFDALGLVFEGYGLVGEQRDKDLAGRPVDASASFPGNGGEGKGLAGLRGYVRAHRQDDFVDNLVRKLLAYALGRSLMLSDDPTVATMKARLARSGYRWGTLVDSVILSPQFLNRRGRESLALEVQP